jgi:3-phytase
LKPALDGLGIKANTHFSPRDKPCSHCADSIPASCSRSGYSSNYAKCECFSGFSGPRCGDITCKNGCSSHGTCVGPNTCKCKSGWAGPDCSFVAVKAKYETDANGGDGDDPAIWINPADAAQSKIVTTTKSEEGAGFAVFDLKGNLLQHQDAEEPNNVDVIYGFQAKNRTIDLTFAACRGDNTLW